MTLVAKGVVLSDDQSAMIRGMRIMAICAFQLDRADRMMTGLKEVPLNLGMTRIADIRLIGEQQGLVIGRVRVVAPGAIVVFKWIVLIGLAAQQSD